MGEKPKIEVGGQHNGSLLGYKDDDGKLKILGGAAGDEVDSEGIKGKLSADLYNIKYDGA